MPWASAGRAILCTREATRGFAERRSRQPVNPVEKPFTIAGKCPSDTRGGPFGVQSDYPADGSPP